MQPYKLLNSIDSPKDLKKLDYNDLHVLCNELRRYIIEIASKKGGHLGASLGVVELTIAIHTVFDAPKDLLVWDIGHQGYPHKILTGRRDLMHTIRQSGGLSGFLHRDESIYDTFGAGHSSTALSAGFGMAIARDNRGENYHVVAIIGDGAMSAGMAYEALNNIGNSSTKMLVILNDNKMSIAPAVGAMSRYLAKLLSSNQYYYARNIMKRAISHIPKFLQNMIKKLKKCAKEWATGGNFFEELGFHYIGPVDGHDLEILMEVLGNIKDNNHINKPILLHVITEKGKGFDSPDKSLESYHAVLPFDLETKRQVKPEIDLLTYTKVFAQTLFEIAKNDKSVIVITAAMTSGTGLTQIAKEIPDQFFDVGIAEQHAVTFAGGMAANALKPFVAIYSTFLQRGYDQIVHDIAIQSLAVRFMIDRAGLVGSDGPTHAGSFDIAYLSNLPNFICMAPSGPEELSRMIATAYQINDRPSAVRYPKSEIDIDVFSPHIKPLRIGKGKIVRKGFGVAILSLGTRLEESLKAAIIMEKDGYNITVADARFAKPIDESLIRKLASSHKVLIAIEEGAKGGFGSHVAQFLLESGLIDQGLKFRAMCLPDTFIPHDKLFDMYENAGLNANGICELIRKL